MLRAARKPDHHRMADTWVHLRTWWGRGALCGGVGKRKNILSRPRFHDPRGSQAPDPRDISFAQMLNVFVATPLL